MAAIKAKAQITISHLVDIAAITKYYLLQSSTATTPSKPTTKPPSSSWKTTEPSYTSGSTNTLYFCELTEFTDGTWSYSTVSKSSSYEAAKEAYNKAVNAQNTAANVQNNLDNNYTKKTLIDTRSTNQTPDWYIKNYPRQIITEFKQSSVIGLTGETFTTLETRVPWTDSSGGYPKQTARVGNREYWRVGTSDTIWGAWQDALGTAINAAKTATNYLNFSSSGLVIGDMTASSLGKNVLIDSDSVDIRNGTTTLASFGANTVTLGQNNANSQIVLCDGAGTIKAMTSGVSTSYPHYDSILIESEEVLIESTTFDVKTRNETSSGYIYESSHDGLSSSVGYAGISGTVTAPADSSGIVYTNTTGVTASADDTENQTKTWLYANRKKTQNNTTSTVSSNGFYIYTGYTKTSKPLKLGPSSTEFTGDNKTLWSGAWYMQSGQTATLSESVLEQANGISLIFSLYSDSEAKNQEFFSFFIPKAFCDLHNTKGLVVQLHSPWGNSVKYLYVGNTSIVGHTNNNNASLTVGGITYNNRRFVMRYVIGV